LLGQTGKFNDEDAVDILLAHPAAPKHLARKLLEEFVHPSPEPALIDALAAVLTKAQWQMKPVLRTIFTSRVFYSDYAYRSRIKSPADLTISLALALGGKIKTEFVRDQMNRMGQSLLFPPNVKGWDGHEVWINSNTYIVRMNYGWSLAQTRGQDYARRGSLEKLLKEAGVKTAPELVEFLGKLLLDGHVPDATRDELVAYLNRDDKDKPRPFDNAKQGGGSKLVRSVIRVMTALPEFQLA
ncbi:MAG TPA: DUF1800 family protein, partial [Tepidisphaeraceae bacterium]